MRPNLIYQSKANIGEKILLGKITHHLDPEIRKYARKSYEACLEQRFLIPFWSILDLLFKLIFYS